MSAINEVYPHIEAFSAKVKSEKHMKEFTNQTLSDASGVSPSTIGKLLSGATSDPKLSDAAALCSVLGLSLDELCGLARPQPPNEELQHRFHDLEIENAELRGVDKTRLENMVVQKSFLSNLLVFFVISVATSFSLLAYIIGDAMHPTVGLIQNGTLSKPAVALIVVIGAAIVNAAILAYRVYRYRRA